MASRPAMVRAMRRQNSSMAAKAATPDSRRAAAIRPKGAEGRRWRVPGAVMWLIIWGRGLVVKVFYLYHSIFRILRRRLPGRAGRKASVDVSLRST